MENSVYLAQLLGPVFAFLGVVFAFRINKFEPMVKDFNKSPGLIFFSSFMMLFAGMALVMAHNVWEWGWPLVITIMGWGVLLKGALYAAIPEQLAKLTNKLFNLKWIFVVAVLLWVVFGLGLTYYGYFM